MDSLLRELQEHVVVATGESFDPSPANIESRLHRSALKSGMRLAFLSKKNRGEAVSAVVSLRIGNEKTLANRGMAASLTAQMLMRGTKALNRQQLTDSLNKLTAKVMIAPAVVGNVRRDDRDDASELRGDAEARRRDAPPAGVRRDRVRAGAARGDRQRRVAAQRADDARPARVRAADLTLPKGHARYLGLPDEQSTMLKSATVTDIRKFYAELYGASAGELTVVGDFDERKSPRCRGRLWSWKSASPFKPVPVMLAVAASGKQTIETPDKANALFVAGQPFAMKDTDVGLPGASPHQLHPRRESARQPLAQSHPREGGAELRSYRRHERGGAGQGRAVARAGDRESDECRQGERRILR